MRRFFDSAQKVVVPAAVVGGVVGVHTILPPSPMDRVLIDQLRRQEQQQQSEQPARRAP